MNSDEFLLKMISTDRRLAVVIPATLLATASLGAVLYCSGRLRFKNRFPYVSCSLKKSFATVRPSPRPRLGAPKGGITVQPESYPWAHRDNDYVEEKFGARIADPYRWLEDPDAPRTAAFVESQNFFAAQILEQCQTRDKFKLLFTELYNTPRFGCPHKEGEVYYFSLNSGLQNQSCIYYSDEDFKDPKIFLDPNDWSEDGTVALSRTCFSKDGQLCAYMVSSGGSDWQRIRVIQLNDNSKTGEVYDELRDDLNFVKHSSISWTHDNKGFFYSRYADPGVAPNRSLGRENTSNKYHTLYYHVLGTPQNEDVVVMRFDDKPEYMIDADVTEDGRYLILSLSPGCSPGNAVSYIDLTQIPRNDDGVMNFSHCNGKIAQLVKGIENAYHFVANEGSVFTFQTDCKAPRWKLVKVDIAAPALNWTELVGEHEKNVLAWACAIAGDRIVLCIEQDCSHVMEIRRLSTGERIKEIDVPKFGSVTGFSGKIDSEEVFFCHQSYNLPPTVYCYNADSSTIRTIHQTTISRYNPDDFETHQFFVESKDKKARIPMFVTHKKGLELNGNNPTLMTGYGGFGVSILPSFSVGAVAFVMAYGGVYVSTNLRGGNEYGLEWRRAGNLGNKQNVFDDFQSCAEYLIDKKYCTESRLAIRGGSNGGTLVAACANQRPDLFGCVVCDVGVLDMLRFHLFTIGHAWVPEYGDPDALSDFEFLIKYSPLHNVRQPLEGTKQFPSILFTTGDHDDRVSPLHTFKHLAELQHVFCSGPESVQTNPIIARIETRAGHGAGKPTAVVIDELSDIMGFIASSLQAEWVLT